MLRTCLISMAALCFAASASSQTTAVPANVKIIHNRQKTDISTRNGTNPQRILYTQAIEAHRGYGNLLGWVAALTDMDSGTSENVDFGVYSVIPASSKPDRFQSAVYPTLSFKDPKNPTVKVQNVIWTITLKTPTTAPEHLALYLGLGPAKMSGTAVTDGVLVHTQTGGTSRLPAALRKDWCWYLDTISPLIRPHLSGPGTTLDFGAIYEKPVLRQFIHSTRYSATAEDLYGLEACFPDTAKGDLIGWEIESDQFKNGLAITMLGGGLMAAPASTPFGMLWMNPPAGLVHVPAVFLGTQGMHKTPNPIPGLKGIKLYSQSACIDPKTLKIQTSDLTELDIQ